VPAPEPGTRTCQWCGGISDAAATTCRDCGAALGERESLGGVVVPGVTAVDPALQAYDAQPWRLPRSSPSQGMAGGTIAAAAMGGPVGIAALGGLAAVAAVEYLSAKPGGPGGPTLDLGQPSEAALQMVERLNANGDAEPAAGSDGEPSSPAR
jgi:hypothetical protein